MTKTQKAKLAKIQRKLDLMQANLYAIQGQHDKAKALFAKQGIGYCLFQESAN